MRILVADDEQVMLDSIYRLLQNEPDLILETARNGREAIEKAENFHPELIIMDIKMPGINGLEALLEIRRFDPAVILVILSAYDNFIYTQEAIHLNVLDYLLKPITKARLLEIITKAKQELLKIKNNRQEELILREKYKKLLPVIETEFLHHLIDGIDPYTFQEYQELLGTDFKAGFFIAISYQNTPEKIVESEIELEYIILQKMADLSEEIHRLFPCFIGPIKTGPLLIFIPINPLEKNPVESHTQKILDHFKNNSKCNFKIGIGRVYSNPIEMGRSSNEAIQALSNQTVDPICYYRQSSVESDTSWESDLYHESEKILDGVRFGQINQVQLLLQNLFFKNATLDNSHLDRFFFHLIDLLISSYHIAKETYPEFETPLASFYQIKTILTQFDDFNLLTQEILKHIIYLTQKVKEKREFQVSNLVRQAKEIIDQRYQEHLTLEELSHLVNISPFYLCRLFREELGVNFTDYLTKLRMEKAVALLSQGLSVKECCFAVGYNDPNYFSRIFRKFYMMSPSEYREEKLSIKGGDSLH